MKQNYVADYPQELGDLCNQIRQLLKENNYSESEKLLREAMSKYPHAPHTHNLFGLLLESQGDHLGAMKHFRSACALDPTYIPVRQNMNHFASFYPGGKWAFDESDCPEEKDQYNYTVKYDEHGIGRVVRSVQG